MTKRNEDPSLNYYRAPWLGGPPLCVYGFGRVDPQPIDNNFKCPLRVYIDKTMYTQSIRQWRLLSISNIAYSELQIGDDKLYCFPMMETSIGLMLMNWNDVKAVEFARQRDMANLKRLHEIIKEGSE
jgi:hypothetical protein